MLYLIIIVALWRVLKRWRAHCRALPYTVEDYTPPPLEYQPPDITQYIPQIPQAEEQPDTSAEDYQRAELERLDVLKMEYCNVLDAIEREQADLRAEYDSASVKRRSQISGKLTALMSKHASVTSKLSSIEAKRERAYYKLNFGG